MKVTAYSPRYDDQLTGLVDRHVDHFGSMDVISPGDPVAVFPMVASDDDGVAGYGVGALIVEGYVYVDPKVSERRRVRAIRALHAGAVERLSGTQIRVLSYPTLVTTDAYMKFLSRLPGAVRDNRPRFAVAIGGG